MRWLAALGLICTTALPAAADATSPPEPDYAPTSCAAGAVAGNPPRGVKGNVAHYEFLLPDARADVETIEPLLEKDQRYAVEYYIDATGTLLRIVAMDYAGETLDVDRDFVRLCGVLAPLGFNILHIQVHDGRIDEAVSLDAARKQRLHLREWDLSEIPDEREIADLLRTDWQNHRQTFFGRDTELARVRENDILCSTVESDLGPLEDHFKCEVGVLGMSQRGPEYGKGTLELKRSRNFEMGRTNKLEFYWAPIVWPAPHR